jgi:hypothetical protein
MGFTFSAKIRIFEYSKDHGRDSEAQSGRATCERACDLAYHEEEPLTIDQSSEAQWFQKKNGGPRKTAI